MTGARDSGGHPGRPLVLAVRVTVVVAVTVGVWWTWLSLTACIGGPCEAEHQRELWRWDRWAALIGGLVLLAVLVTPVVQAASIVRSARRSQLLVLLAACVLLVVAGLYLAILGVPLAWVPAAVVVGWSAVRAWPGARRQD